jgi:hypothetical protein
VLEVVEPGGDGFFQTGHRKVEESLQPSLFFFGQRLTLSQLNCGGTEAIGAGRGRIGGREGLEAHPG